LFAIGVVVTIVLAVVVVTALLESGGTKAVSDSAPLIAAVVALGGVATAQMVGIALDDRRAQEARNIEAERSQEARNIEAHRAEEASLQRYFEQMGKLLADPDRPLHRSTPGDNLSTVVRAQTLTILEGLNDPTRMRILLQFLYEARLIAKNRPVVNLREAQLMRADLIATYLSGADLSEASLNRADLDHVDLSEANLREAKLRKADLRKADLRKADLRKADLRMANLREAYLVGADLIEAKLEGANLEGANLQRAKCTEEQIKEAWSLEGATMPNGQKYEEWLKDKEGRGEDGENSGPS